MPLRPKVLDKDSEVPNTTGTNIYTMAELREGLPKGLLERLGELRRLYEDHKTFIDRAKRIVTSAHDLAVSFKGDGSTEVTIRFWKPADKVVVVRFPNDEYAPLRDRINALGLSWEGYMEQVCHE